MRTIQGWPDHIREFEAPCEHCEGTGHRWDDKALGKFLTERRQKLGLTQKAVAKALMGISPQYLADLEKGRRAWATWHVRAYVRILRDAEKAP